MWCPPLIWHLMIQMEWMIMMVMMINLVREVENLQAFLKGSLRKTKLEPNTRRKLKFLLRLDIPNLSLLLLCTHIFCAFHSLLHSISLIYLNLTHHIFSFVRLSTKIQARDRQWSSREPLFVFYTLIRYVKHRRREFLLHFTVGENCSVRLPLKGKNFAENVVILLY